MYAIHTTIFQWHILPFIVGVGLILSGSLWLILVLPVAWILSILPGISFIVKYLLFIVSGWVYGGLIFSYFDSTSQLWYWASRVLGVVFMNMAYAIIMVLLGHQKIMTKAMEANERLRGDSE